MKELIKYKGHQVAPATLEGILNHHPKVADSVVIGIYREEVASEVPVAYIVPATGVEKSDALAQELVAYVQSKVQRQRVQLQ